MSAFGFLGDHAQAFENDVLREETWQLRQEEDIGTYMRHELEPCPATLLHQERVCPGGAFSPVLRPTHSVGR